jgi:two-component system, OmpR family, response regulator
MNQDMGKTGYILIVNNDPMMRQTVSGYFSEHNFPTHCASNWSELNASLPDHPEPATRLE